MQIVLALAHRDARSGDDVVAAGLRRVEKYFTGLTAHDCETRVFRGCMGTIFYAGVKYPSCRWAFCTEDDRTAVVSTGYPRR